jgi:outer membrane protein assembly factor BamB
VILGLSLLGVSVCLGNPVSLPQKETPAVASALFDDFDDAKEYPSTETLRGLLAQVPGEPYEVADARKWEKPIRRVSGLSRLNSPWPANSALRLSILDSQNFQLHLWSGAQGVTLRYYPEYHQTWGAYGTTREGGKPRPAELALWATSEDYYRRVGIGTVEIHIQAGRLFLIRGDLTLLSVPMANPPLEVFLEGAGLVRGLAWVESKWTPEPVPVRPALLKTDRPAELSWDLSAANGIRLDRMTEGQIELAAEEKAPAAQALVSFGNSGIHEFTVEVEDADAGTGVCFADAEGKPIFRVGFFRHRDTGKKVFDVLPPWAQELERNHDVNKQPVPYAGKRQWLRVVSGAGIFKLFTSGDGVGWRQPTVHSPAFEGACVKIGLYCLAAPHKRSIKLRSLMICRLSVLYAGVSDAVLASVPSLPKKLDRPEDWQVWMAESRPPAVEPQAWWRACVLRTLGAGAKPQVAQPLLARLQQSVLEQSPGPSVQQLVEFMHDSVLLYASEQWPTMDQLAAESRRFGWTLVSRSHPAPFTAACRAMMRWPFWNPRRLPVFPDDLLRHELFMRAGQDREESTREFCRRMRYWNRTGGPRQSDEPLSVHAEYLIQWADPVVVPRAAAIRRGRRPARPPSYQAANPLVEQIGKEGFNTISEIRAAVDGQAWREACQIVVSVPNPESLGLVPDGDDSRLLVSFPLAVAAEMRDSAELTKTMVDQFGKIGRLRLTQAMAAGDDVAVQAAVAQFAGTPVAAEGRRWLGDRRLASGRFSEAAGYYRRAAAGLPSDDRRAEGQSAPTHDDCRTDWQSVLSREMLLARYRLAGSLLGQDWGRAVPSPVELGGTSFSAAEFEQTIEGLKQAQRGSGALLPAEATELASSRGFTPGRYELRPYAKADGQTLKRPAGIPDKAVDWVIRQTAVLATPRQLVYNNRAELIALDLGSGQARWAQQIDSGDQFQRWPLVPMRPVAFGERILVRRLTNDGPELACIEGADGKIVWTSKPEDYVASDPVVVDGRPMALCASHEGTGKYSLVLVEFNVASGRARSRMPVAEFRQSLRRPLNCQIVLAEDRLVVSAAGCVLAFSPSGHIHWIRRQVWVPPPGPEYQSSKEWFEQHHEPLWVAGTRVYATQPGVWGIECMELESGRLIWRQGAGNLTRLVGRTADRLILATSDGPVALDPETGHVVWTRPAAHCLAVRMCRQPDAVVCLGAHVSRTKRKDTPDGIALSWYDMDDGRALGSSVVDSRRAPGWLLGPLVGVEKRQWIALAAQQQPAQRELLEMVRIGDAETP